MVSSVPFALQRFDAMATDIHKLCVEALFILLLFFVLYRHNYNRRSPHPLTQKTQKHANVWSDTL